ncbi:MAG TPA: epoxyqueuosine reductase [Firmicutes bacterium]|nr:epoxyqueuosine reductase [Bacillota bacterium]
MGGRKKSDKETLLELAGTFTTQSQKNYIQAETNPDEAYLGLKLFAKPLMAVAAAGDAMFQELLAPEIVGPHFLPPEKWLPGARSVISFFLPVTERVKKSNTADENLPSLEWLYARIEGQQFIDALSSYLLDELKKAGYRAVAPSLDERFQSNISVPDAPIPPYNSNWSERHVAYVCGLGTFGLHTCLITELGTAGRLCSIVTDLELEPTPRKYATPYEYCTKCGACLKKCPAGALSAGGKSNLACSAFMRGTRLFLKPRYGCGKCQTGLPCESRVPTRAGSA